jgi:hypothetical protein
MLRWTLLKLALCKNSKNNTEILTMKEVLKATIVMEKRTRMDMAMARK